MISIAAPGGLSRRRRWLLTILLVAGLWLVVEVVAFALLSLSDGRLALPGRLGEERAAAVAPADRGSAPAEVVPADVQATVLHPFLGYVEDPGLPHAVPINPEGFSRVRNQRGAPPPDRFAVGIFGGSVAQHVCLGGAKVLQTELARLPQATGRRVWLDCYALGGYKQPQPLLALGYALARGERFDLVLNLDGFNDVALPVTENLPNGVNPFFPRSWHVTAAAALDRELLRRAGEAAYLEARRTRWAGVAGAFPLRYSAVAHALWRALDRAAQRRLAALAAEAAAPPAGGSFLRSGPPYASRPLDATLRELAALWGRSSRLMDGLCRSRGIPYFHFLQPNQFVEGSKPMGAAERKAALGRHPFYARAARRGYPELIAEGARLRADGERFFDLTRIFAEVEEPLYVDDCCHLSPEGTERLAKEIAARVLAGLG